MHPTAAHTDPTINTSHSDCGRYSDITPLTVEVGRPLCCSGKLAHDGTRSPVM